MDDVIQEGSKFHRLEAQIDQKLDHGPANVAPGQVT
jgi:hypothetical protein